MCHNGPLLKCPCVFYLFIFNFIFLSRLFHLCGELPVVMMIMKRVLWEGIMHHRVMFRDDQ